MTPTKEELDHALNEIKATFLSRETKLAKAYAEHPDPDAWYLNFISCLAKVAAGPPPLPSITGHKQPAAGAGVRLGVEAEAEVKPEAANDSGGCNVTAGAGATSRKRPRVQVEDGGSNGISNGTGTGKKVRVAHSTSTGETEYRAAEGVIVNTTRTVRNRHPLDNAGLITEAGDMKVEVKREEEEIEKRNEAALMVQEEATKQEIQERLGRRAQRRRLTRGIRPRKRIQSSSSE